ncbi:MAG: glycosyltransferase family 9 protein [Wenzhouxiangellaceae bacterium]
MTGSKNGHRSALAVESPCRPAKASVCLIRLSALGDVCHCVALVRAVQAAVPECRLTWIVGKNEFRLVRDLPGIEFIVFDKRAGIKAFRDVRSRLAGRRFDALLHAQVSVRANLLALLVGARRRIGFDRTRSREGHGLVVNERIAAHPRQHQALALLEFALALGANTEGIDRAPPVDQADREFARRHQPEAGRAVLISPCSSHAARNWSAQRYAAVADWIVARRDRPVILMGGPSSTEQRMAAEIQGLMDHDVRNLVGRDTLGQSLAMLERAACLIAPDSGPVHFADALGTPVVGLYASTWSRRSGPLESQAQCVDRFPEACRMFLRRDPEQVRWGKRIEVPGVMDLIEVDDVIARLDALLAN